jgi:hypothetical protein
MTTRDERVDADESSTDPPQGTRWRGDRPSAGGDVDAPVSREKDAAPGGAAPSTDEPLQGSEAGQTVARPRGSASDRRGREPADAVGDPEDPRGDLVDGSEGAATGSRTTGRET